MILRGAVILLGVTGWTNLAAQSLSTGTGTRTEEAGRRNDRLVGRNAGRARMPSRLPMRIDTRLNTRLDDRHHVASGILKPLEQSKTAVEAATTPRR